MKIAANIIAVLAWGLFLTAIWYPFVADVNPPLGYWICIVLTFLIGLVVPVYLLNLDASTSAPAAGSATATPPRNWPARREE